MHFALKIITSSIVFLMSARLVACPICHTDTARLVRAGLLETLTHLPTILSATLPFAISAAVVILIDKWPDWFKSKSSSTIKHAKKGSLWTRKQLDR